MARKRKPRGRDNASIVYTSEEQKKIAEINEFLIHEANVNVKVSRGYSSDLPMRAIDDLSRGYVIRALAILARYKVSKEEVPDWIECLEQINYRLISSGAVAFDSNEFLN